MRTSTITPMPPVMEPPPITPLPPVAPPQIDPPQFNVPLPSAWSNPSYMKHVGHDRVTGRPVFSGANGGHYLGPTPNDPAGVTPWNYADLMRSAGFPPDEHIDNPAYNGGAYGAQPHYTGGAREGNPNVGLPPPIGRVLAWAPGNHGQDYDHTIIGGNWGPWGGARGTWPPPPRDDLWTRFDPNVPGMRHPPSIEIRPGDDEGYPGGGQSPSPRAARGAPPRSSVASAPPRGNPSSWINAVLTRYPSLNNPASIRAMERGANPSRLLGHAQFDSHAANLLTMNFAGMSGPANMPQPDVPSTFRTGNWRLNEHGGFEQVGSTFGLHHTPNVPLYADPGSINTYNNAVSHWTPPPANVRYGPFGPIG